MADDLVVRLIAVDASTCSQLVDLQCSEVADCPPPSARVNHLEAHGSHRFSFPSSHCASRYEAGSRALVKTVVADIMTCRSSKLRSSFSMTPRDTAPLATRLVCTSSSRGHTVSIVIRLPGTRGSHHCFCVCRHPYHWYAWRLQAQTDFLHVVSPRLEVLSGTRWSHHYFVLAEILSIGTPSGC